MRGFIYRRAMAMKDKGEQWNVPALIRLGLFIRGRL
jgi:hypothetical protein